MDELKKLLENAGIPEASTGGQFGDEYDDWDEIMQSHLASLQYIAETDNEVLVQQALRNNGWEGQLEGDVSLKKVTYNDDGSVSLHVDLGDDEEYSIVTVLGRQVKGNW